MTVLLILGLTGGAAAAGHSHRGLRDWLVTVNAPARGDPSLAEIRFGPSGPHARAAGARSSQILRLALAGTTGLDYVAAAVPRPLPPGGPRAFVLVVNRRRGSLAPDLVRVSIKATASRRLGRPVVLQFSGPYTRPAPGPPPALCDLPIKGAALAAADLQPVLANGPALSGFSAAAAIAQAYDTVCGRPADSALRGAVTPTGPCPMPVAASGPGTNFCCPPNAMCLPPPCGCCGTCCGTAPCPLAGAAGARRRYIACPQQHPPTICPA